MYVCVYTYRCDSASIMVYMGGVSAGVLLPACAVGGSVYTLAVSPRVNASALFVGICMCVREREMCVCACMCVCLCVCVCVCLGCVCDVSVYVCLCVDMYICVWVRVLFRLQPGYTHTQRQHRDDREVYRDSKQ